MEDSFYGPSLRAFPVKFFYQGIIFPHRIIPQVSLRNNTAVVTFKTHEGKAITPENISVKVDGKAVDVKPADKIRLALNRSDATIELKFSRKYFYTPEEAEGYERRFLISNNRIIELSRYEAIVKALAERNSGLFKKLFGKSDSYSDYLKAAEEKTREGLKSQLASIRNDSALLARIASEIKRSEILKKSELGKIVADMIKFEQISR